MEKKMTMKTSRYLILAGIVRTGRLDMKNLVKSIAHSPSIQGLIKSGIVQPIYKQHQLKSINITFQGRELLESLTNMNKHTLQYRHIHRFRYMIQIFFLLPLLFLNIFPIAYSISLSAIDMILLFSFIEILISVYLFYIAYQNAKLHVIPTITKNQFQKQARLTDGVSWNEDLIDLFTIQ